MVLQFQQTNPLVAADPPSCNLQKSFVSSRWEPHPSNWFFSLFRTCQPGCSSGESGGVTTKKGKFWILWVLSEVRHGVVSVIWSDLDAEGLGTQNFTHPNAVYHCLTVSRSESPGFFVVSTKIQGPKKNEEFLNSYHCIITVSHPKVYDSHIIFCWKRPNSVGSRSWEPPRSYAFCRSQPAAGKLTGWPQWPALRGRLELDLKLFPWLTVTLDSAIYILYI